MSRVIRFRLSKMSISRICYNRFFIMLLFAISGLEYVSLKFPQMHRLTMLLCHLTLVFCSGKRLRCSISWIHLSLIGNACLRHCCLSGNSKVWYKRVCICRRKSSFYTALPCGRMWVFRPRFVVAQITKQVKNLPCPNEAWSCSYILLDRSLDTWW